MIQTKTKAAKIIIAQNLIAFLTSSYAVAEVLQTRPKFMTVKKIKARIFVVQIAKTIVSALAEQAA